MVLWCIHQKVFEAFWSDGETFPSKVVVDDVHVLGGSACTMSNL